MKLDGQQQPPQMSLDIMKDTKVIVCGAKQVDLEKGIEVVCDGEAFDEAVELDEEGGSGIHFLLNFFILKVKFRN